MHYCIDDTVIYGFEENTAECKISNEGIYVFHNDKLLGDEDTVEGGFTVKIYQCTGGNTEINCKKTYGYVLNNNQLLEINASGINVDPKKIDDDDTESISTIDECNPGEIYIFNESNIRLCISSSVYSDTISSETIKTYIMNNIQGNIFTTVSSDDVDNDKLIIIQIGNNKVVLSNFGNYLKINLKVKFEA